MDLEFSPSVLDTPSLMTPNINTNPLIFKSSYATSTTNNDNHNSNYDPSSIIPTTTTTTINDESLSHSSAEIKLSKIEDDLKLSFTQPRKPTESPFQKIAEAGVLSMTKNVSISLTNDDGIPFEIPSTAEVMNVIESFSKNLTKDNLEREATTTQPSDNNRLDISSSSTSQSMGVIVAHKKQLLMRSQSHTEPTSSPPPPPSSSSSNQYSQSQTTDESSIEDNHFQRLQDLPIIDSNTQIDMDIKPSFSVKTLQQPIIFTNKRTHQQAMPAVSIPKANSIVIPPHEVTSTGQLLNIKRQKANSMPTNNNINIRSSTNDDRINGDDQRKKQIRDSNREAARRCRERRRHYIEQLEGNLEQCKMQMKQLNEKLSRAERENTQLRAIITEAKIFQTSSSSRLSSNETLIDFPNMISTTHNNGIELNSELIDGNTLQRNFINRNTH